MLERNVNTLEFQKNPKLYKKKKKKNNLFENGGKF